MAAFEDQPCVGLFGTCGESIFRQELFIPKLKIEKIPFYNPQVAPGQWDPSMSVDEADHLAYDVVQDWPVTGETYGSASLTEQGYSIASSLRAASPLPKFVVPMIEMELSDKLDDEVARKESIRARKLAMQHLRQNASPNVFLVDSLPEMLETTVVLFRAAEKLVELVTEKNPAYQRFMEGRAEASQYRLALASGQLGRQAARIAGL